MALYILESLIQKQIWVSIWYIDSNFKKQRKLQTLWDLAVTRKAPVHSSNLRCEKSILHQFSPDPKGPKIFLSGIVHCIIILFLFVFGSLSFCDYIEISSNLGILQEIFNQTKMPVAQQRCSSLATLRLWVRVLLHFFFFFETNKRISTGIEFSTWEMGMSHLSFFLLLIRRRAKKGPASKMRIGALISYSLFGL